MMSSIREHRQGDSSGKAVAFTFDDGPHAKNTLRLLDIASEAAVKLTFFVLGQRVEQHSHIIQRQVSEGHEVGNHSWSHPDLTTLDPAGVRVEVQDTHDIIVRYTGIKPRLFRPPYGHVTDAQREWLSRDFGYRTILWTIDSLDWRTQDAPAIAARILRVAHPGSIVLLHDIHQASIEAMPAVFESLLLAKYELVTLSELLRRTNFGG